MLHQTELIVHHVCRGLPVADQLLLLLLLPSWCALRCVTPVRSALWLSCVTQPCCCLHPLACAPHSSCCCCCPAGSNPLLLAHRAEQLLAAAPSRASLSASLRPERQAHGPGDYSALLRSVPVGLAYRGADQQQLVDAVDAAVCVTHPDGLGRDGAHAIAAAVAWLAWWVFGRAWAERHRHRPIPVPVPC